MGASAWSVVYRGDVAVLHGGDALERLVGAAGAHLAGVTGRRLGLGRFRLAVALLAEDEEQDDGERGQAGEDSLGSGRHGKQREGYQNQQPYTLPAEFQVTELLPSHDHTGYGATVP